MNSRAHASIFIGYVFGQKACKTYNPTTKKVFISRDVTFLEHHFPYHYHTPPTSPFSKLYLPTIRHLPSYDDSTLFTHTHSIPPFTPTNALNTSSDITTNNSPPTSSSSTPTQDISLIVDLSHVIPNQLLPANTFPTPKSTRLLKPPSHLKDFVCATTHCCNVVHFDSLPSSNQLLLLSQSKWQEPSTYKQAALDPLWVQAMNSELQAL